VDLKEVQVIGLKPPQTLLETGPHVVAAVVMGKWGSSAWRWVAQEATAFRSQEVLIAAVREMAADQFLATAVVERRVDEIDARIKDRVEYLTSTFIVDGRTPPGASQFHGAIAENGDLDSGAAERTGL